MPNRRNAVKRLRVDRKKRLRNLNVTKQLKKTIKKFQKLVLEKNIGEAKAFIGTVFSQLDKAAKKKILHPNTAHRRKSRLSKRLFSLK